MKYKIIKEENFEKARKEIKNRKGNENIIFSGENDEINRKVLEKEKIDILLLNQEGRKDSLKQRNSGLNSVLAKIMKKNNVMLGINMDEIIESEKKQKSDILARIRQNIKLCIKNRLKVTMISQKEKNKRDIYDIKSLGIILGMPTWMISSANFINNQ